PSSLALENWSYRLNALGFVLWTFTLIAGSIWAEQAWGRYWNWDTKEVWTFVIWVLYAGYLHARATRGWTGTRSAWLNITGFLAVVFTYTIVNLYFPSLPSYAGFWPSSAAECAAAGEFFLESTSDLTCTRNRSCWKPTCLAPYPRGSYHIGAL